MGLGNYPLGTIVHIGTRRFEKVQPSSFWREHHAVPGNCVSRPAVSLETLEIMNGEVHTVVTSVGEG